MKKELVHVMLGEKEFGILRAGGCGLANCLFFVARGVIYAHRHDAKLLRPTWERFGIGPILRREADKRFYFGLFKGWISWATLYKCWCMLVRRPITILGGWWNYFVEMPSEWPVVHAYFEDNISKRAIKQVPASFKKTIAVHVRMGDMPAESRVPLAWTMKMLDLALAIEPNADILLFSDATDAELAPLLQHAKMRRVFYGNALADIVAMSRTQLIIGTCSTFSWWGAYYTQIPIVQPKNNSGCCHQDPTKFCVMTDEESDYPESFKRHVREAMV